MISSSQTKVRIHADHVGSLLRPQKLKETRARLWEQGVLARFGQEAQPAELSTIENTEILSLGFLTPESIPLLNAAALAGAEQETNTTQEQDFKRSRSYGWRGIWTRALWHF